LRRSPAAENPENVGVPWTPPMVDSIKDAGDVQ
jgi:hypothetical protein